jgi:5-aminopentanamidase
VKLALSQYQPSPADPAANLARLRDLAHRAARAGAGLLLCPEMTLTGYAIGRARTHALATARGDALAAEVAAIAASAGIAIVYGYPERDGTRVYNAARLVDRDGIARLDYRKTHLFGDAERATFSAGATIGDTAVVADWRVALLICYDVEFPEAVRLCALAGAEVVLVPTALMQPYASLPAVLIPARAYENQCYVAYANYCGREGDLVYCGNSVIAAPDGRCLARAAAHEALLYADFDRDALHASRRLNTYFSDRRPPLYAGLCAPSPDA